MYPIERDYLSRDTSSNHENSRGNSFVFRGVLLVNCLQLFGSLKVVDVLITVALAVSVKS